MLVLENGSRRDLGTLVGEPMREAGLEVVQWWAFGGQFPDSLDGYVGLLLSGSPHGAYENLPFIQREHTLIREAANAGLPMLGVCFGSQILASALCGRDQVFRRETCDVGFKPHTVSTIASTDPVCRGLDDGFSMFVWHNDEVRHDHPDVAVIASTEECPNQIWRHRELPAWGIQGHLEITRTGAPAWFEARRERLEADGADVDSLIRETHDAPTAKTMLANFIDSVSR
ncbi:MAG: type 1 glutamine amidotransferase [Gammaproteobacteria bacterium]